MKSKHTDKLKDLLLIVLGVSHLFIYYDFSWLGEMALFYYFYGSVIIVLGMTDLVVTSSFLKNETQRV